MVSAFSLCLLTIGITAVSSQVVPSEGESPDTQVSERRTFKGKPVKFFPLIKKHKKTGGLLPHVFGKTQYTEVPIIHEGPVRPLYKFHRYQGIEVKPVSDVPISGPGPIIETHGDHHGDFAPTFTSDHSFSSHYPSNAVSYDKPVFTSGSSFPEHSFHHEPTFSAPPSGSSFPEHDFHHDLSFSGPQAPAFTPLPHLTPVKTVISFIPVPSPQIAPVFSPLPFSLPSPHAFPPVSLPRPAPEPILPPVAAPSPVFTAFPAPQPHPPVVPSFPIKLQAPSPAPIFPPPALAPPASIPHISFSPVPAPSPAPIFPTHPSPSPAPAFSALPVPSPAPAFSALPVPSPAPAFSAIPVPSPTPIIPSLPAFPTPAPGLSSISISSSPEPEFPYPPSGTPIPSFIKDISLGDIDTKDSPLPTVEPVDIHHTIQDDGSKNLEHVLGVIKNDQGFLQKLKGWKADKANVAYNHFVNFRHKPSVQPITIPHNKLPLELPASQVPVYPNLQFSAPIRPLPLVPAPPVFFPPAPQFLQGAKYESFPPNAIESPPLFNSYGVPIPQDSYGPPQISHDRLAPAASEEEPAVVPPPSAEQKQEQKLSQQPEVQQVPQEFQPQNFQPQFQPQSLLSHNQPVYVPEENKTVKEDVKLSQEVLPERDNYQPETDANADVPSTYSNHKE